MGAAIGTMFFAYGMTIIVSMSVAVLIKLMTTVLSSMQQSKALTRAEEALITGAISPPLAPNAVTAAGGEEDIAVITAAVYTVIGSGVRVVRIERKGWGTLWTASGRLVHQNSHLPTRRTL